jgi:DNA/RNA-binding domain of Phe-tRNA-synthetase-like protein
MTKFQYAPKIMETFPSLIGGVIIAENIQPISDKDGLFDAYRQQQQATIARIGDTPLSQIPSLSAWRAAFRKFDIDPTKYRSAAESLLRRLTKKGDIPSINTLVDIGNLVSVRYAMPVAVFDTRFIDTPLTVHFADGTEEFTPLGRKEIEHPQEGEVIFSDESKQVSARRWCWRQSDQSAAQAGTTDAIITVEAHHTGANADIQKALDDLAQLLKTYCDADCSISVLDTETLAV